MARQKYLNRLVKNMLGQNQKYHNFDLYPEKAVEGFHAAQGWKAVLDTLRAACGENGVLVVECYPGVQKEALLTQLKKLGGALYDAEACALSDEGYHARIDPFLTDDRVFGIMNTLRYEDVFEEEKLCEMRGRVAEGAGLRIVYGVGASLVTRGDVLVYCDMPRWELQCRYRAGMPNWKTDNAGEDRLRKFKQGFFVEWRMADRQKRRLLETADFWMDTVLPQTPKLVCGAGFRTGLRKFASEPFRLVPYYAPEVWGGQWMKEVCGLSDREPNYAWAFDGVPEENSIFMRFGDVRMEFPAVDVVFYRPERLLGRRVHARFGDEFPIRFDFLDTMGGQNLSLQVHPLTEYIQHTFGMHYTQDESYYILDCGEDPVVYLGLREGVDGARMIRELKEAQSGGAPFDAAQYVNRWPAKKHDHFLIPAGTVHCSGKNTMVLEVSATPYIFTFKLWDWGRLGLDGKPRPVHIGHGEKVIQWDRTESWVRENLVNRFETLREGPGFSEVRTGLHEREFIETRRYTLSNAQTFDCAGSVSMCNVVEGRGVVISSPCGAFEPFEAHYAETFILPAAVKEFVMEPLDGACMVLRAYVR